MTNTKESNKLNIESGEEGSLTLKGSDGQVKTTREYLVDALVDYSDGDMIFAEFQKKKLAKKREQYELLKPAGFEYAPKSVIKKREELKNSDNVEKMELLKSIVSYNPDKTINILPIHKTFCEDISGQNGRFNFVQAQELEKTNAGGYKLMTDYNDTDSQDVKELSDWYKLIHIFSNGNGDTVEGMELFRDMAGCNNRYWTATPYKNEQGKIVSGIVRDRGLSEDGLYRSWDSTNNRGLVCGFKPAP